MNKIKWKIWVKGFYISRIICTTGNFKYNFNNNNKLNNIGIDLRTTVWLILHISKLNANEKWHEHGPRLTGERETVCFKVNRN